MNLRHRTKVSDIVTLVALFALSFILLLWLVISKVKVERGLALQDLLSGAYEYLETIELKPQARIYLLDHLATTEYVFHSTRLYLACNLTFQCILDIDFQRAVARKYS